MRDEDLTRRIRGGEMAEMEESYKKICSRRIFSKEKGKFYRTTLKETMLYWSEC